MNFGMIMLHQSTKTTQNSNTWILIVLLLISLLKTFLKISTMMLKDCLIHLTMMRMIEDHIQDYFKYILKKHGEDIDEPPGRNICKHN